MTNGKARIKVMGPDIRMPPLLETTDAHIIEFHDGFGDLCALLVKIPGGDELWGLVTKKDEDWIPTLMKYGYMTTNKSAKDIIQSGF